MQEPIEFYFDFSSPYGYLMSEKIDAVAARYGRQVKWRPILLGIVFQATGVRPPMEGGGNKATYMARDIQRSARFLDVPYRHPSRFPLPTQNAARTYYWLHGEDCGTARAFAHAVFRALFVDDRDISAPDTVLDIAGGLGIDRQRLAAALPEPSLKERLRSECDRALARGVFGAPHLFIDDEPFFGVDRLPQIERWLERGGF